MALEIAKLPDSIKGFGHVKLKSLETVRVKWDTLLAKFQLL
jgi:indolepyruvate ferredoxin oxidoreductase